MKKIIAIFAVFLLAVCFAGCGSISSYKPPQNYTPSGSTENPAEPSQYAFTVKLTCAGEEFVPPAGIKAQWYNDAEFFSAAFNDKGVAEITGLDGNYNINLSAVPTGYAYNPNKYTATNDRRVTVIELYKVLTPPMGSGKAPTSAEIYKLSQLGAYSLEFTKPAQTVWCQFRPDINGVYTIESIADISENALNPKIDIYDGNSGGYVSPLPRYTDDDSGICGVFTKNFRFEIKILESEVGSVFIFTVRVTSRNDVYPVNVDFIITRERSFEPDKREIVRPPENIVKAKEENGRYVKFGKDDDGGRLDGNRVAFNDNLGCYCLKNPDGTVSDKILYAKLKGSNGLCNFGLLESYRLVINNKNYVYLIQGYDKFIASLAEGELETLDAYFQTWRPSYADMCNSDGAYPVTKELKEFFYLFSRSNHYFFDGITQWAGFGTAEAAGYMSSEANQWLFACGYYA